MKFVYIPLLLAAIQTPFIIHNPHAYLNWGSLVFCSVMACLQYRQHRRNQKTIDPPQRKYRRFPFHRVNHRYLSDYGLRTLQAWAGLLDCLIYIFSLGLIAGDFEILAVDYRFNQFMASTRAAREAEQQAQP
jgi:hypothetical protein